MKEAVVREKKFQIQNWLQDVEETRWEGKGVHVIFIIEFGSFWMWNIASKEKKIQTGWLRYFRSN